MKKFVVVNHITTYKEVEASTREEAIELALSLSPDEAKAVSYTHLRAHET